MHWFDCFKCRLWKFDSWAEEMHYIAQLKSVRCWKKAQLWFVNQRCLGLPCTILNLARLIVMCRQKLMQRPIALDLRQPTVLVHLRQATVHLRPATAILWSSLSCHHLYHCPWPSGFKTNMARIDPPDLSFLSKYSAINQTLNLVFAIVKIYF